jgi:ribosomal-protein-alanine N-acetyltransferase
MLVGASPTLVGQEVTLRPARESDKTARLACPRSAEAIRMYGGDYRHVEPVTAEEVERWFLHYSSSPQSWVVEVEGRCIGNAQLERLSEANRSARYAAGLFDASTWGSGYGTELTRLVLKHAFEDLHLHRVDLLVLEYNLRAIACYKKCGFAQEGVLRDSALVAGEWHSDLQMSVLEHEYRAASRNWFPREAG